MQTIWDYSLELEAHRLLHNAHQIATGFFKLNNFLVLPKPYPNTDNLVYLPDLPYLSIPRFWERSSRINISDLPLQVPPDLTSQALALLSQNPPPKPEFTKVQKLWAKSSRQILNKIYQLVPSKRNHISQIFIWPTAYGTSCSFNLHKKPGDAIYIWLREDQGIAAIVEAILTSLTRLDVYNHLSGLWSESEIIVDWLLAFSPLAKLISSVPHTIKSTRATQSATLLQKSQAILQKIGAPQTSPKQIDPSIFSPSERQLFDLLTKHSPNIVTFDQINDQMNNCSTDKFSLFAISKSIQRLRDKLESQGISGSFIQTKRGEGYLLVN